MGKARGSSAASKDGSVLPRRAVRPLSGAFLCALGFILAFTASPALAITEGHVYSFSFGSSGTGSGQFSAEYGEGVAIDQSNGDVYVADSPHARIEKFDSAGNFIAAWGYGVLNGNNESQVCNAPASCQVGLRGGAPGQFTNPTALAVDNSNSLSQGDLYVADTSVAGGGPSITGLNYVLRFNSDGTFLNKIDGEDTPGGKFETLPWQGAISVAGQGDLFVTARTRVMRFDNDAENEYVGNSEWATEGVWSLAANSGGTKLLVGGYLEGYEATYFVSATGHGPGPGGGCGGYFAGDLALDEATNHFFVANNGEVCEVSQNGEQVAEPFGSSKLSSTAGLAVNETTGAVYVDDWQNSRVAVFTPRVVPTVALGDATNPTPTEANLTGTVEPDPSGGGPIGECYFQYLKNSEYEAQKQAAFQTLATTVPCAEAVPITTSTPVTAHLTGLTPETTYAYRVGASNSIDANHSPAGTFTPHFVLDTSTNVPADVTATTATLRGSLDPAGNTTHYYFEWGSTSSYGHNTAIPPGSEPPLASGQQTVTAALEGLAVNSTYHYRIVAENNLGIAHGSDVQFRTAAPQIPTIGPIAILGVNGGAVRISATVNPHLGPTVYRTQYGTSTSYGDETAVEVLPGEIDDDLPIEGDISGLSRGTTYHLRVVATNFGGTAHGPDITFRTSDSPAVFDLSPTAITATTVTLNASVDPGFRPTTVHIEYGTTRSYGSSTQETGIVGSAETFHPISVTVTRLTPATTYHFRVTATNDLGITEGIDQTATTAANPPEVAKPVECKRRFVRRHGKCVLKRRHGQGTKGRHHHTNKGVS